MSLNTSSQSVVGNQIHLKAMGLRIMVVCVRMGGGVEGPARLTFLGEF